MNDELKEVARQLKFHPKEGWPRTMKADELARVQSLPADWCNKEWRDREYQLLIHLNMDLKLGRLLAQTIDKARCVYPEDFAEWLQTNGLEPSKHIAAWFKSQGVLTNNQPHEQPHTDKVSPPYGSARLTTTSIAHCFDGLHRWDVNAWKKNLGNKPKWLSYAIVAPGQRGVSETLWSPVLVGGALVNNGTPVNSVRARFQRDPVLQPFLDDWKTYEADNTDTP